MKRGRTMPSRRTSKEEEDDDNDKEEDCATAASKDMNLYHINSNVYMNSYMQNKNSLPLTDHVNCAS
jgi:hypothetical protein